MKKTIKKILFSLKVIFSITKNLFAFNKENSVDFTRKTKSPVKSFSTSQRNFNQENRNLKFNTIVKCEWNEDWAGKVIDC